VRYTDSVAQARRDGEVQLHPLEQREADLSEELHRQKEKERLRKEYIEELKKRHEEEKNRLEALHLKEQAGRRDDQVGVGVVKFHKTQCNKSVPWPGTRPMLLIFACGS